MTECISNHSSREILVQPSKSMIECDLNKLARENLREQIRTDFIEIDGVFLPEEYKKFAKAVDDFEVYDDDVWVCSFQKSGTTWTQEMVWCIANNLDFESAKVPLNERYPFLEFSGIITTARAAMRNPSLKLPLWITDSVEYCNNLSSPRFIKSHHPLNLLPRQIKTGQKKPRIIYVARNPKDVCVSFYHHSVLLEGYCGNFDDFCKQFLGDKVVYAPYWNHVNGFWEMKDQENVLFLKYEDMKKDLSSVIKKTAKFLGKTLNEQQIKILAEHLSFEKMKSNPSLNREMSIEWIRNFKIYGDYIPNGKFIRSGTIGQWKTSMSNEMIDKFDKWIEENSKKCKGLNL